jgi:hypothetical protein
MNGENSSGVSWRTIGEVTGVASIVASLIFVGLQFKQAEAIARAELWTTSLANEIEYEQVFIDNANVWTRGNAGDSLSAGENEVFRRLVLLANDRALKGYVANKELGLLGGDEQEVPMLFASWLTRNPGALEVWRDREFKLQRDRRSVDPNLPPVHPWVARIEKYLSELDTGSTDVSEGD